MSDYHKMYLKLASTQTNVIDTLKAATEMLIKAQQEAENILLEAPEPDIRLLPHFSNEDNH